jgi:DNA-binding MarR family transcriptional regulator
VWHGDLQRLVEQGLVERTTVTVNREPTAIVALTREGRDLLNGHQQPNEDRPQQTYYAGIVKPRELGHDAQLYRVFQAEAGKIEAAGGRVERVVIDHELKREYQRFLNRPERDDEAADRDVQAFADAWGLPVIDGHLELPDLRIEYETPDGGHDHRDVELLTEHYSRGQLAGKARSGFSLYRAAGSRNLHGGSSRQGGTPFDPHNLEWLQ